MTVMATDDTLPDPDDVPIAYARIPATGAEIHAALSAEDRAQFEAEWQETIEQAAETFDLQPAQRLLSKYRTRAVLDANPEIADDFRRAAKRHAAGQEPVTAYGMPPRPLPADSGTPSAVSDGDI